MIGIIYKKKKPVKALEFPGDIWSVREMNMKQIVVIQATCSSLASITNETGCYTNASDYSNVVQSQILTYEHLPNGRDQLGDYTGAVSYQRGFLTSGLID